MVNQYKLLIFFILFCISLIGLGVFCYIVNLRLDVILYARVVNGIRKFFYDRSGEDINLKQRLRVLPQSPQLPSYYEKYYFLPVVVTLGIMNSIYFCLGEWVWVGGDIKWVSFGSGMFFLLHFGVYWCYSRHRETTYLKSNIIGIDIDGVLNRHRDHFCKLLKEHTQKEIKPEQIFIIPVHEYSDLSVTREDERKVFNDPRYWKDMPSIEDASDRIRSLRNVFKLKIYIFTYRPWPDVKETKELINKIKSFCKETEGFTLKLALLKIAIKLKLKWLIVRWKEEPLKQITKQWLKKNGFIYDKFIFEKGNDYSSDPRGKFNNRFFISRKKKIRFFVEDDCEKAIKLSYICDVVFLISHPYNEPNDSLTEDINELRRNLPANIICVKNWLEIYQYIRRLA